MQQAGEHRVVHPQQGRDIVVNQGLKKHGTNHVGQCAEQNTAQHDNKGGHGSRPRYNSGSAGWSFLGFWRFFPPANAAPTGGLGILILSLHLRLVNFPVNSAALH